MRWDAKPRQPDKPGWFAWYPVYLRDVKKWVWWERVERIPCGSGSSSETAESWYEYEELT
jgi:hypothetical protein